MSASASALPRCGPGKAAAESCWRGKAANCRPGPIWPRLVAPARPEREQWRPHAVSPEHRPVANPHADHVVAADRRRRGAGADPGAHRVLDPGARGRRSVRRGVRPRRQHAGPGGDRDAGPRQFDGGGGQALPRRLPAAHDDRGRPLHHQRPVADLRPSARSHRGQPDLSARRAGRAVRQHRACRRYRRARHGAGRAPGLRGGAGDPADGAGPRRPDERGPAAHPAGQRARAAAGRGRRLRARRLQRRRQPPPRRDDGRIRHHQSRPARRAHRRDLARGDAGGDPQAAARHLTLAAAMTIGYDGIHVDYTGMSPASAFGINVVMNYTLAYTAFGVKCLVAPEVPNNAGSLAPITASAPEGCLLNVKRPRAVAARHTVGHMLPDVVFGCLHQVMEGGVPAEGASSLWNPQIYGGADVIDELGGGERPDVAPFSTVIFHCGGTGARPGKDGLDVTAFPSGVRTIPVEATESVAPVLFRRREFREGSGGAGRYRGGLGQVIELGGADAMPVAMLCNFERINNPARGRDGGGLGAPGRVSLVSGKPIRSKGRQTVPGGDFIRLELPGGGGFGDPATRDPDQVASDVADGLISAEAALRDYRVALAADGTVDRAATARLRLQAAE